MHHFKRGGDSGSLQQLWLSDPDHFTPTILYRPHVPQRTVFCVKSVSTSAAFTNWIGANFVHLVCERRRANELVILLERGWWWSSSDHHTLKPSSTSLVTERTHGALLSKKLRLRLKPQLYCFTQACESSHVTSAALIWTLRDRPEEQINPGHVCAGAPRHHRTSFPCSLLAFQDLKRERGTFQQNRSSHCSDRSQLGTMFCFPGPHPLP